MKNFAAVVMLSLVFCFWGVRPSGAESQDDGPVDPLAYWHYACGLYAQLMQDEGRATVEFDQAAHYDPHSALLHNILASNYYLEGLNDKTEDELQESIRLDPNNIQTRLLLASLFSSENEYGKAQKEYDDILAMDPSNVEARYYLAGVLADENNLDDALQAYEKILDSKTSTIEQTAGIYYNMGLIYIHSNQVDKAEAAFERAIKVDPELEPAYTSLGLVYDLDQKPLKAIAAYEDLLKVDPQNAQTYLSLGELYYNQKDDQKALKAFQTYSQLNPKDSTVLDYIGLCYFALKDDQKAVESFQKLLKEQPTNALVRFRLSAIYEEMKNYSAAEDQMKAILANDDTDVDAWVQLGILYDKENKEKLTAQTLEQGLNANPGNPELILMQGMLDQENNQLAEAEVNYRQVIHLELQLQNKQNSNYNMNTLVQAYFNLGAILDQQNKFDEAMDMMKKVIELQPDNAEAFNYIGYSYADKNENLSDAQKYVESAIQLDPDNAYYLDSLGWVYFRQGHYTEAKVEFEKALKYLPKKKEKDDAVIYDHLAQTDIKLNLKNDAVTQWKEAIKLDQDNKDYAAQLQKYQNLSSE